MRNEDWIAMFKLLPPSCQNQLVLVLLDGTEVTVELIFRYESTFLVVRGRVSGTTDEGRAFFIPYDRLVYFRIEETVKVEDLGKIFGETVLHKSILETQAAADLNPAVASASIAPAASTSGDPAVAARAALLERIRAARASSTPTGRGPAGPSS